MKRAKILDPVSILMLLIAAITFFMLFDCPLPDYLIETLLGKTIKQVFGPVSAWMFVSISVVCIFIITILFFAAIERYSQWYNDDNNENN